MCHVDLKLFCGCVGCINSLLLKLLVAITQALRVAHKLLLVKRLEVEHVDSK